MIDSVSEAAGVFLSIFQALPSSVLALVNLSLALFLIAVIVHHFFNVR